MDNSSVTNAICVSLIGCFLVLIVCHTLMFCLAPVLLSDALLSMTVASVQGTAKRIESMQQKELRSEPRLCKLRFHPLGHFSIWHRVERCVAGSFCQLDGWYVRRGLDSAQRQSIKFFLEILFLSLAVSSLVCDSLFHLMPEAYDILRDQSISAGDEATKHLVLGFSGLCGIMLVFIVECVIQSTDILHVISSSLVTWHSTVVNPEPPLTVNRSVKFLAFQESACLDTLAQVQFWYHAERCRRKKT